MAEFADILDQVQSTLESLHGVQVTYTPADGSTALRLSAVPTNPAGGVNVTDETLMVESKSRDFLIRACSLRRGSAQLFPQKGDTISELTPSGLATGYVYTVTQPATSDAPWRWHDRARRVLRIHTKETAVPA